MGCIAIHAFSRIGRSQMKAALENSQFAPVSDSDVEDAQRWRPHRG
jgi:hypothetical protein